MNEKERIIRIMNEENMNASQFSESIGIQRAAISHIIAGRNNPSLDVIKKILKKFSTINPDWLLYGEGPMRRNVQNDGNNSHIAATSRQDPDRISESVSDNSAKYKNSSAAMSEKYDLFSQPPASRQSSVPETRPAGNKVTTDRKTNTTIPVQNSIYPTDIRTEIHFTDEKIQGEEVNCTANQAKEIVKETIIYKERPNKTIEKLLIFYSDKTFETFIPEK